MQRVLEAVSTSAETCASCSTPLTDERCGHCGAAARAGPYRVLKVIARSQHGAMYLAEDDAGAKVALKELVFSLVPSTQELDAFSREAELLKALDHPRIPKFLKSFTVGQGVSTRLYLAQQYLSGQTLTQCLADQHYDEDSVLQLAKQALQVLAYLHGRSPVVIHRDVKPDNFIVGSAGSLSLVDFGAARSVKAQGTHGATLVGTFGYMAPEQLGGSVDARSDLYGLGATLVHLLTRLPPERMLSPGMSLDFQKHVNVSVKTERFLSRLVATRPNQRFASAEDALAYLEGRSTSSPRQDSRGLIAGALTLALFAGGLVTAVSAMNVKPKPVGEIVTPPPELDPVTDIARPEPPSGTVNFPFIKGEWGFSKPGYYVIDESGHGHHALLPTSGYAYDMFGLVWDGTTGLSAPDSSDFALQGPFTIEANFRLGEGPLQKTTTLISRGDPNERFSWALQLVPDQRGPLVRFAISNENGDVSSMVTPLKVSSSTSYLYAEFDPKTGAQSIVQDCETSTIVTKLRPSRDLPHGSRLQLINGFRGHVSKLKLMSGLMKPTGTTKPCGYSGERLGEE